ncbi:uncharacterized protein [Procambarus clarkii]|uniref:uncharacterized protein isoform X2 n=1 Tax=Procambarus clarkii TaxID=6728 RepID=UPI001E6724BE|nr:uncharacterized protein LOC123756558 [Procambarus clarkii]
MADAFMVTSAASSRSYGHSPHVDCNSALALLGFILFIDILRDIVDYVTAEKEAALARKKRWTDGRVLWENGSNWEDEPDILTFISEGGSEHLYDALPSILGPLVEEWQSRADAEGECLQRRVCHANWVLARHYGTAGRVIATLLTRMVEGASGGGRMAAVAGKAGRRLHSCESFPACPRPPTLSLNATERS